MKVSTIQEIGEFMGRARGKKEEAKIKRTSLPKNNPAEPGSLFFGGKKKG